MMNKKTPIAVAVLIAVCTLNAVRLNASPWKTNLQESGMKEREGAAEGENAKVAEAPKLTGRLPRYFSSVVSPEQRMDIYRIQADYRAEIAQLQMQLQELREAEIQKVEAVLSATQLKQVNSLREKAAARRIAFGAKTKPEEAAKAKEDSNDTDSKTSASSKDD
ncbi:MAG: hypothetical protein AAF483_29595 [Planctomycetota bacterium]